MLSGYIYRELKCTRYMKKQFTHIFFELSSRLRRGKERRGEERREVCVCVLRKSLHFLWIIIRRELIFFEKEIYIYNRATRVQQKQKERGNVIHKKTRVQKNTERGDVIHKKTRVLKNTRT